MLVHDIATEIMGYKDDGPYWMTDRGAIPKNSFRPDVNFEDAFKVIKTLGVTFNLYQDGNTHTALFYQPGSTQMPEEHSDPLIAICKAAYNFHYTNRM